MTIIDPPIDFLWQLISSMKAILQCQKISRKFIQIKTERFRINITFIVQSNNWNKILGRAIKVIVIITKVKKCLFGKNLVTKETNYSIPRQWNVRKQWQYISTITIGCMTNFTKIVLKPFSRNFERCTRICWWNFFILQDR